MTTDRTARAMVLTDADGPPLLELADIHLDAPASHEVVVRTVATGVCHSDVHVVDGHLSYPRPVVLGHETSGVVEEVGSEVTHVAPGDHVVACIGAFCGVCDRCIRGQTVHCRAAQLRRPADGPQRLRWRHGPLQQFLHVSGFSERLLVHEQAVVRIPGDVPLAHAALFGCAVLTGVGAVLNTAKVQVGEQVAVIGCGGIGLNCVQGARLAGASRIVAVDVSDEKLHLARRFGATETVLAGDQAVPEVIALTTGGVDHAFDAVGGEATASQAFAMLARRGTATIIGIAPRAAIVPVPIEALLQGERRIQGSSLGSTTFRRDVPRYIELYQSGRLEIAGLLGRRRSIDELGAAFDDVRAGELGRTIIEF